VRRCEGRGGRYAQGMTEEQAADLKKIQDSIYRERILRARSQTPEERLAEVFELSNSVLVRMHEGAMWQRGIADAAEGWNEVRRRLRRLSAAEDFGRYVPAGRR
jgi:hypothetical protein